MKNPFRLISELIGRARQTYLSYIHGRRPWRSTVDRTKADYQYFDRARRGLVSGLEISGLLLHPVASKTASWVLGRPVMWNVDSDPLAEALNDFFVEHQDELMAAYQEAVAMGDFFIVVNPDLTLTTVTPDVVEEIVADDDYGNIIGWRITQRFDHPSELGKWMIEINEYYADKRVQSVEFENQKPIVNEFTNPIGKIPVIHVVNNRLSNETYGQPEGAALVATSKGVLHRYGEILDAGLDGNLVQGRPTPVAKFKDVQSYSAFLQQYVQNEQRTKGDGTSDSVPVVDFDHNQMFMLVGDFDYAQPGAFAAETEKFLAILYWIFLEYIEIPEFVMGTAIQGSRASADTQMPIFIRWIEKKRSQVRGWMTELAEVVSALQVLTTPGLRAAPSGIRLVWEDLTGEDGKLTLDALKWAFAEGLLDRETALQLAPVDVEDVAGTLKKAKAERDEAREEMEAQFERELESGQGNENDDEDGAVVDVGRKAA